MPKYLLILLHIVYLSFAGCVTAYDFSIREVVAKPGIFPSNNSSCQADISISELGGFKVLSIRQMDAMVSQETEDVTGIAWMTESILVYSVSPIYGNPGLYIFNCTTKETKRIVAPKNINAGYPNGADYFELYRLSADKVYFYYTADVDSINFKTFRSQTFLFQSNLDGSDVGKAVDLMNDTNLKQDIKQGE